MKYKTKLSTPEHLEELVADTLGLKMTNGSGSKHNNADSMGKSSKGKIEESYNKLMAECKFSMTPKKSATIKLEDMEKTRQSAARYGRIPIMATGDPNGNVIIHIGLDDFENIYQAAKEHL